MDFKKQNHLQFWERLNNLQQSVATQGPTHESMHDQLNPTTNMIAAPMSYGCCVTEITSSIEISLETCTSSHS
jgi:hypothetical protein